MRGEAPPDRRSLLAPRPRAPVEHRLDDRQHRPGIPFPPRVGERPGRLVGERRRKEVHLVDADRLARRPRRNLVDLERERELVLADDVARVPRRRRGSAATPRSRKRSATHPASPRLSTSQTRSVACLRTRLRERRVLLAPPRRRGTARCRAPAHGGMRRRLHVRRPSSRRKPAAVVAAAVDLGDEHEALARGGACRRCTPRRRLRPEAPSLPAATRRSIEPASKRARRRASATSTFGRSFPEMRYAGFSSATAVPPYRCDRTVRRAPSDSTTTRPSLSVRNVVSPDDASSAPDRLGPRVAVVVPRPDRDHRDAGSQHPEELRKACVLRAVVRDLQDLDPAQRQPRRHVALRVGGEQDVGCAVAREQDDGVLVRVLAGKPGTVRPEDAEPQLADAVDLAGADDVDRDIVLARGRARGALVARRRRGRKSRVDHGTDAQPTDHVGRAADVVALRVRQHDRRQRPEPEAAELARHIEPPAAPGRRARPRRAPRAAPRRPGRRRET